MFIFEGAVAEKKEIPDWREKSLDKFQGKGYF